MAETPALDRFTHGVSRKRPGGFAKENLLFHNMINGAIRLSLVTDGKNTVSDFVILDVNAAWEKITGMKRSAVLGRRMSRIFPGMEPRLIDTTRQMLKGKKGVYFEYYSALFGRYFQTSVFSPKSGECIMLFSDITQLKLGQKTLEESEDKFRSIIEQSGDGIVLIDDTGEIIDCNATMEKMCGIKPADAIGKRIWDHDRGVDGAHLEVDRDAPRLCEDEV
jgi:PAS domain-containing protein